MKIRDVNFVMHWLEKGNMESEDIYKFLCYYISFNRLYGKFYTGSERIAINKLISECVENNNKFELIKIKPYGEFYRKKVIDVRNRKCNYTVEKIRNNDLTTIFIAIYQVRCNLFHGSKEIDVERDKELIKESNKILKEFLEIYLENFINL